MKERKTFANQLSEFLKKGSTTTCYVKILAKQIPNLTTLHSNWQYSKNKKTTLSKYLWYIHIHV